jgi:hypothetical protein
MQKQTEMTQPFPLTGVSSQQPDASLEIFTTEKKSMDRISKA